VVVTVGFTSLITGLIAANWSQADPSDRAATVTDPVATILGTGLYFGQLAQAQQGADQVLTPWQGFAVLCGWTALLLAAAFYLLRRRDA
jgi:ABC-type transport system involved in multi-copper enzyme maturation permease subunit